MNVKVKIEVEHAGTRMVVDLETGPMDARYGQPHPIVGALNATMDGARKTVVETIKAVDA